METVKLKKFKKIIKNYFLKKVQFASVKTFKNSVRINEEKVIKTIFRKTASKRYKEANKMIPPLLSKR